jgi:hypothetical protein
VEFVEYEVKHSIICTTSEVRALLDGSKTEFHVPLKPQPLDVLPMKWQNYCRKLYADGSVGITNAPYVSGQVIKVREAWQQDTGLAGNKVYYKSDGLSRSWRSAATMPLWASRLSLLVLDVQVSKLDLWKFVVKVEVMK